jgi:hypothetical protein
MALRPENPGKSRKKIKKVRPGDRTLQTERANAADFNQL